MNTDDALDEFIAYQLRSDIHPEQKVSKHLKPILVQVIASAIEASEINENGKYRYSPHVVAVGDDVFVLKKRIADRIAGQLNLYTKE
jgi:hypothetical protein